MSSPAITPKSIDTPVKTLRVLYADDMRELRSLVESLLGRDGHKVESVGDGAQALKKIMADPRAYDVLLTDHHMPVMNGLDLVRRLRELNFPGRIVVFSSELSPEIAAEYAALEVDGVLPKPVHPAVLREIVRSFWVGVPQ